MSQNGVRAAVQAREQADQGDGQSGGPPASRREAVRGRPSARAARLWIGGLVLVAAAALLAGWSLRAVLSPLGDPVDGRSYTYVPATNGEVGDELTLNTVAKWGTYDAGSNLANGVVTSVNVSAGDNVAAGDILYTVNLRPVVVAEGRIPAFRGIESGAVGADVAQVQRMLAARGFFTGEVSGTADYATVSAISAWQRAIGVDDDGVVRPGDVIFVPELPARLVVDPNVVKRGATLSGGEPVIRAVSGAPKFTITMTAAQADMVTTGSAVVVTASDGAEWRARTLESTFDDEQGVASVSLEGRNGRAVCGGACGDVPVSGKSFYSARVITVPKVEGTVVPTSALITTATGEVQVITEDGTRQTVQLLATAQGMSVVEGLTTGARVRTPGESQ